MTSAKVSGFVSDINTDAVSSLNRGTMGKDRNSISAEQSFAAVIGQTVSGSGRNNYAPKSADKAEPVRQTDAVQTRDSQAKKDISSVKTTPDEKESISKEEADRMDSEFEEGVKDILEEDLDVSEEQIEEAMSALGLGFLDLMNPANLSQLVAELTGTDSTCELLMNEDFTQIMKSVDMLTQSLAEKMGIPKEEFTLQMMQLSDMTGQETAIPQEMVADMTQETDADMVQEETDLSAKAEQPETPLQQGETVSNAQTAAVTETVQKEQPQKVNTEEVQQPEMDEAAEENDNQPLIRVNEQTDSEADENGKEQKQNLEQPAGQKEENAAAKERNVTEPMHTAEFTVKDAAVPGNTVQTPLSYTQNIPVEDIMKQITEFSRVHMTPETTSIEMQLNPENLGKVYLHIASDKEGNVTAQLAVTNEAVKEAMETQMADLKTSLNQQGVKVDAVEVTVANHEFEQNLEQNASREQQQSENRENRTGQSTRRIFRGELDERSGLMSEEEVLAAKIMKDNGNTMDVTA